MRMLVLLLEEIDHDDQQHARVSSTAQKRLQPFLFFAAEDVKLVLGLVQVAHNVAADTLVGLVVRFVLSAALTEAHFLALVR